MLRMIRQIVMSLLVASAAHAATGAGRLVIAGGAIDRDTADIWRALLDGLPGDGRIAIIPGASGEAQVSFSSALETLARYGVTEHRVDLVQLAMVDDPLTPQTDEADWSGNASNADEIAKIERAAVVWFTGGDQVRLAQLLLTPDGRDTLMLSAIRMRLAMGATVGGTSAGAAAMSCAMIARGNSLPALISPVSRISPHAEPGESGALVLSSGLCLFPHGTIDQHFDRQARLGRLARAVSALDDAGRTGFGIDENTAMIVDTASGKVGVAGTGSVTVISASGARTTKSRRGGFGIADLDISLLTAGDRMSLATLEIFPASFKTVITPDSVHNDQAFQPGTGSAVPAIPLEAVLGSQLVDNRHPGPVTQVSFDASGRGVRLVFARDPTTFGAWGREASGKGRYTVGGARLSIEPVHVRTSRR